MFGIHKYIFNLHKGWLFQEKCPALVVKHNRMPSYIYACVGVLAYKYKYSMQFYAIVISFGQFMEWISVTSAIVAS